MYRDEAANPPALVCLVGKTELRYQLRCIEDLHAMLKAHGDWMLLWQRRRAEKRRCRAPSRPGAGRQTTRWEAGMG